jgi:hypothetical protein
MRNKENMEDIGIALCKTKIKYVQRLNFWVKQALKGKDLYKHFYITELDKKLKEPKLWLSGSLFVYDCLLFLLENTGLESYLFIPLSFSAHSTDISAISYSELQAEMSTHDRPSIYLCPLEENNQGVYLKKLSSEMGKAVYYEEQQNEEGFLRGLIITKS